MVCVVGLLITPGPYHRIVESGEDSAHILRLVTVIANLSLFPFALALGLDVFITAGRIFGEAAGADAGIAATAVAVAFWYGFPRTRTRHTGEQERAMISGPFDKPPSTPLDVKIEQMLTEARVVLPGAQALFGFQLAIVLTIIRAASRPLENYPCGQYFSGCAGGCPANGPRRLSSDCLCR
jgi:hypothetical protein